MGGHKVQSSITSYYNTMKSTIQCQRTNYYQKLLLGIKMVGRRASSSNKNTLIKLAPQRHIRQNTKLHPRTPAPILIFLANQAPFRTQNYLSQHQLRALEKRRKKKLEKPKCLSSTHLLSRWFATRLIVSICPPPRGAELAISDPQSQSRMSGEKSKCQSILLLSYVNYRINDFLSTK